MIELASLDSIVVPAELGLARDPVHPGALSVASYSDYYDTSTLVYDRFVSGGYLYLVCPKLLNFKPILLGAKVDGRTLRASEIQAYARYDLVKVPVAGRQQVRLEIPAIGFSGDCSLAEDRRFDGRNVLMTMQKNNRLNWIEDWVRSHVEHHGADAVLIFDNASDAYPAQAVADVLSRVNGVKESLVVTVPHKYGPHQAPYRGLAKTRFLQPALWNIARLKYLGACQASLFIDIDEIVISRSGRSVFDATVSSFWGYMPFRGEWWNSEADHSTITHADHKKEIPAGKPCPTKYCLSPHSPFWSRSLSIHKLESDWFKLFPPSSEFCYAHHRKITSNWKGRVKD
jgi:hypothetical protein